MNSHAVVAAKVNFPSLNLKVKTILEAPRTLSALIVRTILLMLLVTPSLAQIVTTTVPAGGQPVAIALNPVTNKMYIASTLSSSVTIIDGATNSTTTIPIPGSPVAIAVNPTTNKVYVANPTGNNLVIIDGATNGIRTISSGGAYPQAVAINPITNRIYVANTYTNSVGIIDGTTDNLIVALPVALYPVAIGVNPVTNRVFVANANSNNVTVINGDTNSPMVTIGVGPSPRALAVNPVTNRVYVVNGQANFISVIDGNSFGSTTVGTGIYPFAVVVNPVTNKIFVANSSSNFVTMIDGLTHATSNVLTASPAYALAIDTLTNQLYIAQPGSNLVAIFNASTSTASSVNVGAYPTAIAVNPITGKAYTANRNGNSVSVIDRAGNNVTSLSVGSYPFAVAANPVTHKIYVANQSANSVTAIDGAANTSVTIPVGAHPSAVAVNPVTNKIYVANNNSNNVTVIDGATNATAFIPVGSYPFALAVNPVTNKIYVANSWSNTVSVIDGATNATVTVPAGGRPYSVAVNPVTNRVYVTNNDSNNLMVLDGRTNAIITFLPTGGYPQSVDVNPVTNKIFVANVLSPYITIIDGATNSVSGVSTGYQAVSIAVNSQTNKIYAANQNNNTITVLDGNTYATTTINRGGYPSDIAIDQARNKIYISNQGSNDVTVIDGATNSAVSVPTGATPAAVAVDTISGKAYVVNANSGTCTVVSPEILQAVPFTTSISPVTDAATVSGTAVFATRDGTPSFTAQLTTAFSPMNPAPTALYYRIDSTQGAWQAAIAQSGTGSNPSSYSFDLAELPLGLHTVYAYGVYGDEGSPEASYLGTGNSPQTSNIAPLTFAIMPITTTTTVTADVNPQTYGESITLTATVLPDFESSTSMSGQVVFSDGGTTIGQALLDGTGHATFATTALSVGTHTISAVFNGSASYIGSTGSVEVTVEKATPVITWVNPPDLPYGSPLGDTVLNATASVEGTFSYTPELGSILTAGSHELQVSFTPTDTTNYNNASAVVQINVMPLALTPTITVGDKVYDGNTSAEILTRTLTGVVGTDDVVLAGGTATFDNKNAGNGKVVTISGLSLTGTAIVNYTLSSTTVTSTANISQRTLNVAATGVNRQYDGTMSATAALSDDRIAGDDLTFGYTATFADKNVGTAKPVTISGITITGGADLNNYQLGTVPGSTTADITPRALHVTASGGTRVYDGTPDATSIVALSDDRLTGDALSVGFTATFADKHVGIGKPIAVTSLAIAGGADQANYTLSASTASTTGTITTRTLTIAATGGTRGYDGTNSAVSIVVLTDDRIAGDALTYNFSAVFADKNVGTDKPISITGITVYGPEQADYVLGSTSTSATGTITPAPATVTPNDSSKVYGSSDPALTGTLTGFIPSDGILATYSRTAGETVTGGPYVITATLAPGILLANYAITQNTAQFTITPAPLTVGANDKSRVFGAVNPVFDGTLAGVVNSDDITATYATAATVASDPGSYPITANLVDPSSRLGNYAVTNTPGTLSILKAPSTTTLNSSVSVVLAGGSVTFTATVAVEPSTVPTGTVTFRDGTTVLGSVVLNSTGTASYSTSTLTSGPHTISAEYAGDVRYLTSSSSTGTVAVQDFSVPATAAGITVSAGLTGTTNVSVTPHYGFTGTVSFTCALPANMTEATCSASAVQITSTSSVDAIVTVTTTAPHTITASNRTVRWYAATIGTALAGFVFFGVPATFRRRTIVLICLTFVILAGSVGCGDGNQSTSRTDPGTPAGTYSLTLTATSGTATHTTTIAVVVQ